MNREIKFRAWNKIWKMMSLVDKIEFEDGKPVSVSTTIEASDFNHTDEWSDYEVGNEIIVQQYTGLKDKNGKEIYEGDIVRTEAKVHSNCKVTFHQGVFGLVGGDSGHYPLRDFTNTCTSISDISILLEVIGNIFENPELIK